MTDSPDLQRPAAPDLQHGPAGRLEPPPPPVTTPSPVLLRPPPPPVPGYRPTVATGMPAQPGHLVPWARLAHVLVWLGCCVGLGMIARSVVVTGIGTWWIPEANRPGLLALVPFLAPIGMIVLVLAYWRWVPWAGIATSVVLALVAWGDVSRVKGYALVEVALAGCGLVVSVASLFGRYRRAAVA